jgi:hypothetical protein
MGLVRRKHYFAFMVLIICIVVITWTGSTGGKESPKTDLVMDPPSLKVLVNQNWYEVRRSWIPSNWIKREEEMGRMPFLLAVDSRGKITTDVETLEGVFFTPFVYGMNPEAENPQETVSLTLASLIEWAEHLNWVRAVGDVTLFIREGAAKALVHATAILLTGGESETATLGKVGKEISIATAKSLVKNVAANPVTYLKATYSDALVKAIGRLKELEKEYKTASPSHLRFERAKALFAETAKLRAFVFQTSIFLTRLLQEQGGGGDLVSQLYKVGEVMTWEALGIVGKEKHVEPIVTEVSLGKELKDFFEKHVPLYKEYLIALDQLEKDYLEYKTKGWWNYVAEPSINAAPIVQACFSAQNQDNLLEEIRKTLDEVAAKKEILKEKTISQEQKEKEIKESEMQEAKARQQDLTKWQTDSAQKRRERSEEIRRDEETLVGEQQEQLSSLMDAERQRAADSRERVRAKIDELSHTQAPIQTSPPQDFSQLEHSRVTGQITVRVWTNLERTSALGRRNLGPENLIVYYSSDRDCNVNLFMEIRKPSMNASEAGSKIMDRISGLWGRHLVKYDSIQAGRTYECAYNSSKIKLLDDLRQQLKDLLEFLLQQQKNIPTLIDGVRQNRKMMTEMVFPRKDIEELSRQEKELIDLKKGVEDSLVGIGSIQIPIIFSIEAQDAVGSTGHGETMVYHSL